MIVVFPWYLHLVCDLDQADEPTMAFHRKIQALIIPHRMNGGMRVAFVYSRTCIRDQPLRLT